MVVLVERVGIVSKRAFPLGTVVTRKSEITRTAVHLFLVPIHIVVRRQAVRHWSQLAVDSVIPGQRFHIYTLPVTKTSGRPGATFVLARGTVPPCTTHALTFTAIAKTNIRAFLVFVGSFCRGGRTERWQSGEELRGAAVYANG